MNDTIRQKLKTLPTNPGVYLMKDKDGKIIYVGKAINLRNRVRSYFRAQPKEAVKTKALVRHIEDLEYIIVDNETEALVLECNLIKKYRPKYNISLKDGKTYPYLRITKEEYPRILSRDRSSATAPAILAPTPTSPNCARPSTSPTGSSPSAPVRTHSSTRA